MRGVFFSRTYIADLRRDSVFHVFWEAGHDRVFLISEPGLKQIIVTLQYTYTIHTMILTPFRIDHSLFWDPSLESFDIPDFNSSFRIILIPF